MRTVLVSSTLLRGLRRLKSAQMMVRAAVVMGVACASSCASHGPAPVAVAAPPPAPVPPAVPLPTPAPPKIDWVRPAAGADIPLEIGSNKSFATRVPVELTVTSVASVEVSVDGRAQETLAKAPWQLDVTLSKEGTHELTAIGRSADGKEQVRASLRVSAKPPPSMTCAERLRADGIDFIPAPPQKGVEDPVLLSPVMAGVTYRFVSSEKTPRLLSACKMGVRLHQLAQLVANQGLDEIVHVGIYNYRPMRNPTCEARGSCALSQHAHATAIDISSVGSKAAQSSFSTQADWFINKVMPICPGEPKTRADGLLHAVACGMWEGRIFSLVLTPNYNAKHRNHFHVDLTPVPPEIRADGFGVDPSDPELLDD